VKQYLVEAKFRRLAPSSNRAYTRPTLFAVNGYTPPSTLAPCATTSSPSSAPPTPTTSTAAVSAVAKVEDQGLRANPVSPSFIIVHILRTRIHPPHHHHHHQDTRSPFVAGSRARRERDCPVPTECGTPCDECRGRVGGVGRPSPRWVMRNASRMLVRYICMYVCMFV